MIYVFLQASRHSWTAGSLLKNSPVPVFCVTLQVGRCIFPFTKLWSSAAHRQSLTGTCPSDESPPISSFPALPHVSDDSQRSPYILPRISVLSFWGPGEHWGRSLCSGLAQCSARQPSDRWRDRSLVPPSSSDTLFSPEHISGGSVVNSNLILQKQ